MKYRALDVYLGEGRRQWRSAEESDQPRRN